MREVEVVSHGAAAGGTRQDSGRRSYLGSGGFWYARKLKRSLDVSLVVFLSVVLVPVIAVLWLMTRLDGGPGFFGHLRIGRNGAPFRCWKIRTMVPNAEERLKEFLQANPDAAEEWHASFKLRNDPRITRLGNFLRKTSLDELPQIWNVLRGEMSFVGPRPIIEAELQHYGPFAQDYLSVRPGITGTWQVSGRNDVDYSDRVRMDHEYVADISFLEDLAILLKTAGAVAKRTGL